MKHKNVISPAEVDFWLDSDRYANLIDTSASSGTAMFSMNMIRLASVRRAISNFIRILTRKNIPVYFNDSDENINFEGKVIYLSAKIETKHDFDIAVGQALHEGAHTLKSDFDVIKMAWANIPSKIFKLSDSKHIRRASLEKFIQNMFNVIEDRYIDNYVFNAAPGYRGYYVALYNKFWNCPEIDEYLISDYYRYPSLASYDFRITNFTNVNTDLSALPKLREIAQLIDISHIDRLENTRARIETAFEVVEVVLECLEKPLPKISGGSGAKGASSKNPPPLADPRDYFEFEDDDQSGENKLPGHQSENISDNVMSSSKCESIDIEKQMVEEISDILSSRDKSPENLKENHEIVNKISNGEVPPEVEKQLKSLCESQRKFMMGELPKDSLSIEQKEILDLIEKSGIILVQIDMPSLEVGDNSNIKIDCIVVNKMTKELIFSGENIFPLAGMTPFGTTNVAPPPDTASAVRKGLSLGYKLGRKLQIRSESNLIKSVRKKCGKINKRQLHEAAFNAEDLFYKVQVDEHRKASVHISVDASSSMQGNKWQKTMTAVTAICKAASMIDNIHVTVSFRSTQDTGNMTLPYIVLAYDSKSDSISKVKNLFPYLSPSGCTPEGLAFSAIMGLFDNISPDEDDRYFVNLSDGEPVFELTVPLTGKTYSYTGDVGAEHTKHQVDKIRQNGIEILSYFIDDNLYSPMNKSFAASLQSPKTRITLEDTQNYKNFRKMYGKNAQFIRVDEITGLAITLNNLFLSKK